MITRRERMEPMSTRTKTIVAVSSTVAAILSALGAYAIFSFSSLKAMTDPSFSYQDASVIGVLVWVLSVALTLGAAIAMLVWSRKGVHPKLFSFLLGCLTSFVALQVFLVIVMSLPLV